MDTCTGTGDAAASAESAASRPRSVRTGGWIPRATWRISVIASFAAACAWSSSSRARAGSSSMRWRGGPGGAARVLVLAVGGEPEGYGDPREPLLRAVVQIALDPAPLGLDGVDGVD